MLQRESVLKVERQTGVGARGGGVQNRGDRQMVGTQPTQEGRTIRGELTSAWYQGQGSECPYKCSDRPVERIEEVAPDFDANWPENYYRAPIQW